MATCIISLFPNKKSREDIEKYLEENKSLIINPYGTNGFLKFKENVYEGGFHTALYISHINPLIPRNEIRRKIEDLFPIILLGDYSLGVFGEDNRLAIFFDDSEINHIKEIPKKELDYQISTNWGDASKEEKKLLEKVYPKRGMKLDYKPKESHITIASFFNEDIEKLSTFSKVLCFENRIHWKI